MPEKLRRVGNALLSVSDKTGIVDLARALVARGIEVISTGGTARSIAEAGIPVRDVAEVTGFPEMMDGRVKTLHPKVHGGLLARREDPEHQAALFAHGIPQIDLLVANLYPFEAAVAAGAAPDAVIEQIDIGGPAMIRAGAKNCDGVAVVTDPADYLAVLAELDQHEGATRFAFRRAMAAKAFARIARYDAAIDAWFSAYAGDGTPAGGHALRYGENPHQAGWVVPDASIGRAGVLSARLVQGKELSYNNIADADAAFEAVAEFDPARTAAVVIVKHANPCGVAEAETLEAAYRRALACDPVSAFGGIIALNRPLDAAVARAIADIFTEVVIAPDADDAAKAIFATKKNLRLMLAGALPDPAAAGRVFRSVAGGMLVQSRDGVVADALDLRVVTERAPSTQEMADLKFAWRVAKHVKSNAIVYARHGATVGIGAGQMSRVDSARIAAWKAGEAARAAGAAEPLTVGSVAASDAFFPFADGLEAVVSAGATAVIQPGGSVRDGEVIAAANKAGIAMVFTGVRHFRH